jgi:hypothetical protein
MPSGTSCNTVSKQRHISSKSTPAAAGGACDGPAPRSSNWCLLASLSGSVGHPAASSHPRLSPRGGLPGSRYTGALYNSTSCPRGAKSAHAQNKQQQIVSVSIHHTYELVYHNHNINQNIQNSTYLDGRTPPQEATPCSGPPESPPQHRGTAV